MSAIILRGNAAHLPLPDSSVDLIVTSPPYYRLRAYRDGGDVLPGQIGSEENLADYLTALWTCTAEWMRVLKPTGSLFVDLGDGYAAGQPLPVPRKSLLGVPWRYALGCIDKLGLILRAEMIWAKPNPMPEPVTDRVRRDHETWFHFTRTARYFADLNPLREPLRVPVNGAPFGGRKQAGGRRYSGHPYDSADHAGRAPGSVWTIPTEPLVVPDEVRDVDHDAAFGTTWPRRLIDAFSPAAVCLACGHGRKPTHEATRLRGGEPVSGSMWGRSGHGGTGRTGSATGRRHSEVTVRRYTGHRCACPTPDAPTKPGVVLDPFSGSGTTAVVADTLGRIGIGIDLSGDYCRLGSARSRDRRLRAKILDVSPPPPPTTGQIALLPDGAAS